MVIKITILSSTYKGKLIRIYSCNITFRRDNCSPVTDKELLIAQAEYVKYLSIHL